MSLKPPTISELQQLYLDLAKEKLPEVDVSNLSDYQSKAAAVAGVGARLALDAFTLFNATYPQNGDIFGINTQLSSLGVPSQYPSSVSVLTTTVNNIPSGKTYDILIGTILTAPDNQNYQVISPDGIATIISISTINTTLYLSSINGGANTNQDNGTIITFSPPQQPNDNTLSPIKDVTVISSIKGSDEEPLSSAVNRLIQIKQTPKNGSGKTDLKYLAINPATGVTDAIVLINNEIIYTDIVNKNIAIFDVGGTEISDIILNKGLNTGTVAELFDRSVSNVTYNNTLAYILSQDICGWQPVVNTVSTQAITTNLSPNPPYIKIEVKLISGYGLQTVINSDGGSFTIYKLIQREVRRAICGQPFGASLTVDLLNGAITSSIIPTSSIEQQLDITLGTPTTNGTLGNYLQSRSVLFYNGTTYEYRGSLPLNIGIPTTSTNPIAWVYDISLTPADIYYNISVEAI